MEGWAGGGKDEGRWARGASLAEDLLDEGDVVDVAVTVSCKVEERKAGEGRKHASARARLSTRMAPRRTRFPFAALQQR